MGIRVGRRKIKVESKKIKVPSHPFIFHLVFLLSSFILLSPFILICDRGCDGGGGGHVDDPAGCRGKVCA